MQQTKPLVTNTKYNDTTEQEERSVTLLKTQINSIVKSLQKLIKDKSPKTRQGCLSLLTQLVNVLPGALSNHVSIIINGIIYSLKLVFFFFFFLFV